MIKNNLGLFSAAIKDGIFTCETNTIINIEDKINVDISDVYLIVFNECFNNCRKTGTVSLMILLIALI